MRFRNNLSFVLLPLMLFVGGCSSGASDFLSFDREIPNEFVVVRQKPLTVPPDLFLRPPRSVAVEYDLGVAGILDEISGISREKRLEKEKDFRGSEALKVFLQRLGVFDDIPSDIREIIDDQRKDKLDNVDDDILDEMLEE